MSVRRLSAEQKAKFDVARKKEIDEWLAAEAVKVVSKFGVPEDRVMKMQLIPGNRTVELKLGWYCKVSPTPTWKRSVRMPRPSANVVGHFFWPPALGTSSGSRKRMSLEPFYRGPPRKSLGRFTETLLLNSLMLSE